MMYTVCLLFCCCCFFVFFVVVFSSKTLLATMGASKFRDAMPETRSEVVKDFMMSMKLRVSTKF